MDLNTNTPSRATRSASRKTKSPSPKTRENSRKRQRTHSEPPKGIRAGTTIQSETSNNNNPNGLPELIDSHLKTHCDSSKESKISINDSGSALIDNRGQLFDRIFVGTYKINVDLGGNFLSIIGDQGAAKRIERKFNIMQKLALLVGCGLDCHFRLSYNQYKLLMLVRGAPRIVFGSTAFVLPDLTNTRLNGTPGEFLEAAQAEFFDSILSLIPRSLKDAESILRKSFMEADEDEKILGLYTFLKTIRGEVLSYISRIPIAWTIQDLPAKKYSSSDVIRIRKAMKECGDNHLVQLENALPGYTNILCAKWGLGPTENFERMMENVFNNLKVN